MTWTLKFKNQNVKLSDIFITPFLESLEENKKHVAYPFNEIKNRLYTSKIREIWDTQLIEEKNLFQKALEENEKSIYIPYDLPDNFISDIFKTDSLFLNIIWDKSWEEDKYLEILDHLNISINLQKEIYSALFNSKDVWKLHLKNNDKPYNICVVYKNHYETFNTKCWDMEMVRKFPRNILKIWSGDSYNYYEFETCHITVKNFTCRDHIKNIGPKLLAAKCTTVYVSMSLEDNLLLLNNDQTKFDELEYSAEITINLRFASISHRHSLFNLLL